MPEVSSDLRVFNDFERNPDLLKKFDKVLQAYSAAAIFADVQYRTGVMDRISEAYEKGFRMAADLVTNLDLNKNEPSYNQQHSDNQKQYDFSREDGMQGARRDARELADGQWGNFTGIIPVFLYIWVFFHTGMG